MEDGVEDRDADEPLTEAIDQEAEGQLDEGYDKESGDQIVEDAAQQEGCGNADEDIADHQDEGDECAGDE